MSNFLIGLMTAFVLAVWLSFIYIIYHFITKFW